LDTFSGRWADGDGATERETDGATTVDAAVVGDGTDGDVPVDVIVERLADDAELAATVFNSGFVVAGGDVGADDGLEVGDVGVGVDTGGVVWLIEAVAVTLVPVLEGVVEGGALIDVPAHEWHKNWTQASSPLRARGKMYRICCVS
jgi:hypothetical protein